MCLHTSASPALPIDWARHAGVGHSIRRSGSRWRRVREKFDAISVIRSQHILPDRNRIVGRNRVDCAYDHIHIAAHHEFATASLALIVIARALYSPLLLAMKRYFHLVISTDRAIVHLGMTARRWRDNQAQGEQQRQESDHLGGFSQAAEFISNSAYMASQMEGQLTEKLIWGRRCGTAPLNCSLRMIFFRSNYRCRHKRSEQSSVFSGNRPANLPKFSF